MIFWGLYWGPYFGELPFRGLGFVVARRQSGVFRMEVCGFRDGGYIGMMEKKMETITGFLG